MRLSIPIEERLLRFQGVYLVANRLLATDVERFDPTVFLRALMASRAFHHPFHATGGLEPHLDWLGRQFSAEPEHGPFRVSALRPEDFEPRPFAQLRGEVVTTASEGPMLGHPDSDAALRLLDDLLDRIGEGEPHAFRLRYTLPEAAQNEHEALYSSFYRDTRIMGRFESWATFRERDGAVHILVIGLD